MSRGKVCLTWLGTAGMHVRYAGKELLLDPFLSRPPGARPPLRARPEDFLHTSLILVSHGHFDHAMDAGEIAVRSGARVHAPLKTCRILQRQGVNASALLPNERMPAFAWNGARIRVLPSRHMVFDLPIILGTAGRVLRGGLAPTLFRLAAAYPLGSNAEFLLDFAGYRVLFSGSGGGRWSWIARLAPDCLLLPFAGRSDLVRYYLEALRVVRPRTVVLTHFDDFYPPFSMDYPVDDFREALSREMPGVRLIVPGIEEAFTLP